MFSHVESFHLFYDLFIWLCLFLIFLILSDFKLLLVFIYDTVYVSTKEALATTLWKLTGIQIKNKEVKSWKRSFTKCKHPVLHSYRIKPFPHVIKMEKKPLCWREKDIETRREWVLLHLVTGAARLSVCCIIDRSERSNAPGRLPCCRNVRAGSLHVFVNAAKQQLVQVPLQSPQSLSVTSAIVTS